MISKQNRRSHLSCEVFVSRSYFTVHLQAFCIQTGPSLQPHGRSRDTPCVESFCFRLKILESIFENGKWVGGYYVQLRDRTGEKDLTYVRGTTC